MRMISPKFKLAANSKEEEGYVIVQENADIFDHGCILYFKVDGVVGTLVLLHYHLYTIPTHHCFPVFPDRSSIFYLPIYPLPHFMHPLDASGRLSHPQ